MGLYKNSMINLTALAIALCFGMTGLFSERASASPIDEAYVKKHKKFVTCSNGRYSRKVARKNQPSCRESKLAIYDAIAAMKRLDKSKGNQSFEHGHKKG